MISHNGEKVLQIKDKLVIFKDFYKHLYCSSNTTEEDIDNFLTKVSIPKKTALHKQILNSPITTQEIDHTIVKLKLGKMQNAGDGWLDRWIL